MVLITACARQRERRRRRGELKLSKALGGSLGRRPRFPSLALAREDIKHFGSGGDVLQNCADKRIGVKRVRTKTEIKSIWCDKRRFRAPCEDKTRCSCWLWAAGCSTASAALALNWFFFFSPLVGKGCLDHFYHAGRCWINMHASRVHRLLSLQSFHNVEGNIIADSETRTSGFSHGHACSSEGRNFSWGCSRCASAFLFEIYSFKCINQAAIFDHVLHHQVSSVGQSLINIPTFSSLFFAPQLPVIIIMSFGPLMYDSHLMMHPPQRLFDLSGLIASDFPQRGWGGGTRRRPSGPALCVSLQELLKRKATQTPERIYTCGRRQVDVARRQRQ